MKTNYQLNQAQLRATEKVTHTKLEGLKNSKMQIYVDYQWVLQAIQNPNNTYHHHWTLMRLNRLFRDKHWSRFVRSNGKLTKKDEDLTFARELYYKLERALETVDWNANVKALAQTHRRQKLTRILGVPTL